MNICFLTLTFALKTDQGIQEIFTTFTNIEGVHKSKQQKQVD